MRAEYIVGLIVLFLVVVGLATLFLTSQGESPNALSKENSIKYQEIVNPSGFVNTQNITIGELIGKKVILVDFMTYSCINCQRTFPYLTLWYEKYKGEGLEIVGIHTPEFAFEKDKKNVEDAMKKFNITYPVVLDNDYATWRAYDNNYWPRKYLIDIYGNVVYDHIGEGAYEETEMKIRELLLGRAQVLGEAGSSHIDETLATSLIPKKENFAQSPEIYFGSLRNEYLANGNPGRTGKKEFTFPNVFTLNSLYLDGVWNITPEYAESISNSRLVYKYQAQDVYIVAEGDVPVKIEVWQDGSLVSSAGAGEDVKEGIVTIQESRLYKLIHNDEPGEHVLEIRMPKGGIRLYAFTFG